MDHFQYRDGTLLAEDVPLTDVAQAVGTPFYCYATATLERHVRVMREALAPSPHLICYAVKANGNLAVLSTLARLGVGADIVSEGEMRRALAAGVPPERIVFAGVGKTKHEMAAALTAGPGGRADGPGVSQFNIESAEELEALSEVASALGRAAPITVRVNPDVDAKTLAQISTGKSENKFGVPFDQARAVYARAAELPGVEVIGVDVHIGSQITELAPFEAAFHRVAELTAVLRADGHAIRRIDLGGGLGIPYQRSNAAPPLPFDYGALIRRTVGGLDAELVVEPGRLIVGNAGVLVSRVVFRKRGADRTFLILDAAMNDLARPAMYDAWHDIEPVAEPAPDAPLEPVDVVGPICESTDTFARGRLLPPLEPGDLVAFRSAGAYGASMASEYNARPLAPEVLVSGDRFAIVRRRPTYDEMMSREHIPDWARI